MIPRSAWLVCLALTACGAEEASGSRGSPGPPNIVFILADDLGWADVGFQGSTFYRTPHIDALSRRGLVFSDAYSAAAVCSPSRAAILTGLSPARLQLTRAIGNQVPSGPPGPATSGPPDKRVWEPITRDAIPAGTPTCATVLRAAGYRTAMIGKWHLGGEPADCGFDVVKGAARSGVTGSYFAPYGLPGLEGGPAGEYLTDRLTDEAIAFMEESADAPFFLYLSHFAPHSPFEAKPELVELYETRVDPAVAQRNAVYAAMIDSLDQSVGRLVESIERLGLTERTLVVFTSDNGGWVERRATSSAPAYHVTSNTPMRAGKGRLYEGGVRVPTIFAGVGVRRGVSEVPIIGTDFLPTFARVALAPTDAFGDSDGLDLSELFGAAGRLDREELVFHSPHQSFASSIRIGDRKLIHFYIRDRDELYDLSSDVGEQVDLAAVDPDLAAELRARLESALDAAGATRPVRNPAFEE